jgi:CheY-like chemotaxis protein
VDTVPAPLRRHHFGPSITPEKLGGTNFRPGARLCSQWVEPCIAQSGVRMYGSAMEVPSRLMRPPQRRYLMPKRILLVDDNPLTRELVRLFIEARPGFEVCGEAADGVEGVEKGGELKPDLIVLDFSMPRANGLETAVILREVVPNTPIILLTIYKDAIPVSITGLAN